MAYEFEVVGYKGWDQANHRGLPSDPRQARGLKVVVTPTDGGDDVHQFWAISEQRFYSWAEWWVYIGALMQSHGMPLEDEPPDGGGGEPPEDEDYDEGDDGEDEDEETPTIRQRVGNFLRRVGKWFR